MPKWNTVASFVLQGLLNSMLSTPFISAFSLFSTQKLADPFPHLTLLSSSFAFCSFLSYLPVVTIIQVIVSQTPFTLKGLISVKALGTTFMRVKVQDGFSGFSASWSQISWYLHTMRMPYWFFQPRHPLLPGITFSLVCCEHLWGGSISKLL